jgi:selenide,water dikinase
MGGDPRTALSILAFPSETLDGEIMHRMLAGAMETLERAGVALIGGHSIKDDEIKLGFAVTGTIDPDKAAALDRAGPGDVLILTKPLGTGVLAFWRQLGRPDLPGMTAAESSMAALNKAAAEGMLEAGASACTDITGFGLFGHLLRLARQSGLTARIHASELPAFDGVLEALRQDVVPGAIERNREFVGECLQVENGVDGACVDLGFDAQTSGGLLIAAARRRIPRLLKALRSRGVAGWVIGEFVERSEGRIVVGNSPPHKAGRSASPADVSIIKPAGPGAAIVANMKSSSNHLEPHEPGCCSEVFGKKGEIGTAAEAQEGFGAMMRAVQSAGALSEKIKELILFGLVVQSRCRPCFDAHYARARQLGLTQAELDEAAWCAIAMGGAPVRMFYQESIAHAQRGR